MHSRITALLWLSAIGIALLSTIHTSNMYILSTKISNFKLTLLEKGFKQYDFISYIFLPLAPPLACDESRWKSRLISEYDVKLVLTVDLKGSCANFSSIQEAVDVAPDLSNTRTLILIASGTYRFSFEYMSVFVFVEGKNLYFLWNSVWIDQ